MFYEKLAEAKEKRRESRSSDIVASSGRNLGRLAGATVGAGLGAATGAVVGLFGELSPSKYDNTFGRLGKYMPHLAVGGAALGGGLYAANTGALTGGKEGPGSLAGGVLGAGAGLYAGKRYNRRGYIEPLLGAGLGATIGNRLGSRLDSEDSRLPIRFNP